MNKKEVEKQLKDYPAALTVKEAAEILRVSTELLYGMIKEKTLPATKIEREKRIATCHLISYLWAKEQPASNPKCVVSDNSSEKAGLPPRSVICMFLPKKSRMAMEPSNIWRQGGKD